MWKLLSEYQFSLIPIHFKQNTVNFQGISFRCSFCSYATRKGFWTIKGSTILGP